MGRKIKLSIIIISFNTNDILRDCLYSIQEANIQYSYEIIIIDNNSSDGSVEMVRKCFPEVFIIENKENNYFAKANNQGAAISKGEYLLLLNSDTLVEANNIEILVSFLDNTERKVACVGPVVLNPDRTIQSAGYALPSISERISMIWHLNTIAPKSIARLILPVGIPGLYNKKHRVGWVSGCCMMVRKEIYLAVGGLNEELEFYGEEPEFGFRLKKLGYETWIVPEAQIIHLGGQSSQNDQAKFLWDEDKMYKRYAALQKNTVGYKKAILMSRLVLVSTYIKYIIAPKGKKDFFVESITWEKKVINFLKKNR